MIKLGTERLAAASLYKEVSLLRAMLLAINDGQWSKATIFQGVKDARERLVALRTDMKRREPMLKGWLAKQEKARIEGRVLSEFDSMTKTRKRVHVGEKDRANRRNIVSYESGHGRGNNRLEPRLDIYVGHMWLRNVYDPLLRNKNLTETGLYFVTQCEEYKINVQHIRLYKVRVWHKKMKEMQSGYIGQSKLGKQPAAFTRSKDLAINLAVKFAAKDIDAQLMEKPE